MGRRRLCWKDYNSLEQPSARKSNIKVPSLPKVSNLVGTYTINIRSFLVQWDCSLYFTFSFAYEAISNYFISQLPFISCYFYGN